MNRKTLVGSYLNISGQSYAQFIKLSTVSGVSLHDFFFLRPAGKLALAG